MGGTHMVEEKNSLLQAVLEFQQGKEEAFNEIYNLTNKYVYYTIYKSVKDAAIAEDVMQDTYLEVYRSLPSLKSGEAVKSWIAKIAHHRIYQYLKKNPDQLLNEEAQETVFGQLEQTDEALMPEDVMDNRETQRLMGEIIDSLSEEQRLSIVAFYFNQMSIKEISAAYGIPENTVKSHLSRGKNRIRERVLELEKKHGTRLYSTGIAAVLFFVLDEEAQACEVSSTLTQTVLEAVAADGASAATAAAGTAGGASAVSGTAVKAGLNLGMKIKIAVAVAALAGGVAAVGAAATGRNAQQEEAVEVVSAASAAETGLAEALAELVSTETAEELASTKAAASGSADAMTEIPPEEAVKEIQAAEGAQAQDGEGYVWLERIPALSEADGEQFGNAAGGVEMVLTDSLWGIVNYDGKTVVPCEYDSVGIMPNDLGQTVLVRDGIWYAFDKEGNQIASADRIVFLYGDYLGKIQYTGERDEWGNGPCRMSVEKLDGTVLYEQQSDSINYYDYGIAGFGESDVAWCGADREFVGVHKDGTLTRLEATEENPWFFPARGGTLGGYFLIERSGVEDLSLKGEEQEYGFTPEEIVREYYGDYMFDVWYSDMMPILYKGTWCYNYGTVAGIGLYNVDTNALEKVLLIDAARGTQNDQTAYILGEFDSVKLNAEKYWRAKEDGQWGYIDHGGNMVQTYEELTDFYRGYALIRENGTIYLINESFEKLEEIGDADSFGVAGELFFLIRDGEALFYRLKK